MEPVPDQASLSSQEIQEIEDNDTMETELIKFNSIG